MTVNSKSTAGGVKALLGAMLVICLGATSGSAQSTAHAGEAQKPNMIFILGDDLGYGDLGSYGQTSIKTPEPAADSFGKRVVQDQVRYIEQAHKRVRIYERLVFARVLYTQRQRESVFPLFIKWHASIGLLAASPVNFESHMAQLNQKGCILWEAS